MKTCAKSKGWDIYSCNHEDHDYEVQKDDNDWPKIFPTDDAAVKHIKECPPCKVKLAVQLLDIFPTGQF